MVDEYQDIDFGEMGGESFISSSPDLVNPNKVLETTGIDVSSKATSDSQDDLYKFRKLHLHHILTGQTVAQSS